MDDMTTTYPTEEITLDREVASILVPHGTTLILPAGTKVRITQALGTTFTVLTDLGYMVRIQGKDADAMGLEPPEEAPRGPVDTSVPKEQVEEQVWEQLRTCYDPEIPVNIAELGLIYGCEITPHPEGGFRVEIKMTLTAPGCGMGDIIAAEVDAKLRAVPGVREVNVELVFDPPWDLSMMPESARLALGLF
jgi:probable FeS assembly SUF system protein SufT